MNYQIGDSRDRNASTDWLCREDQGGESQHSRLHHFGHAQLYIVAFMPVRYRSNDGPCPSATGRHGCNRLMIDMWLCSITMPLVYARRSIHSYLRARLWPSTRNKLSEIEGTPKRTPGPESRACMYGYFFLESNRYHAFSEAFLHPRRPSARKLQPGRHACLE